MRSQAEINEARQVLTIATTDRDDAYARAAQGMLYVLEWAQGTDNAFNKLLDECRQHLHVLHKRS